MLRHHQKVRFLHLLYWLGISCLTACSSLLGQEVKLVSPSEFANKEAPGLSDPELCCPFSFRYQQLFPAADFESLPGGKGLITAIAWRPDGEAVTGSLTNNIGRLVLRLSTTEIDSLSNLFSDNLTTQMTQVLDREVTLSTVNGGPGGGPKDFDYVIPLDEPFLYDTSAGNLLFDWDATDGFPAPAHLSDAFTDAFNSELVRFATPLGSDSGFFVPGFVQEFTFVVPEPSTSILLGFAVCAALSIRSRRI